jgi:hypothetical protein
MAATRKSAKRSKKRSGAKKSSRSSKKTGRSSKKTGRSKKKATRSARGPLTTVRTAGEKTWKALKSTTAQVVEGVKGTFGTDENANGR